MEKLEKEETLNEAEASTIEDVDMDEKTVYELGFHLLPTLSEDELTKEFADIKALILAHKGTVIVEGTPKAMRLAYTMVKKQEGKNAKFDTSFFGWVKFETTPNQVVLLKEEIDLMKMMLRFIVVKTTREDLTIQQKPARRSEEPQPIIKKPEVKEEKKDATPISEAELDKTIEDLVV